MSNSNGFNKTIALIVAISITACAAPSYRRVQSEPVKVVADDKGVTPVGIVEDAMRLEATPIFDQPTYKRLEDAAKSAKDIPSLHTNLRDAICNGDKPRTQPKLTAHLVLNRPIKGETLDVVSERNRLFIDGARIYLEQFWLHEESRPDVTIQKYNSDFKEYKSKIVDTNLERKFAGDDFSIGVPFINGNTAKDAEKYFTSAHATPNIRPLEDPTQWFPGRSFLAVALPNQKFILTNKVSDFLVSTWEGYGTNMVVEIGRDVQIEWSTLFKNFGMSDGQNYRSTSLYTPSKSSWKLSDGSIANPLIKSHFDDLAALRTEFSFRIPKDELDRIFKITDSLSLQYFGYDFSSGAYSASLAMEHQDTQWSLVLANQTEISQTSQEDGNVTFEVKPSFEVFCKYAVPTSSLVAQ